MTGAVCTRIIGAEVSVSQRCVVFCDDDDDDRLLLLLLFCREGEWVRDVMMMMMM